ncbi:glycoside hydrolase superfamily [Daedaleopsis nitida]|nr:glycoside hydrolase superfamily [Daedaleopsis nitida]
MFSFNRMITSVSAALALASMSNVLAAPIHSNVTVSLVSRATIPSPAFVIYSDKFVSADVLPPVAQVAGYNVVALSFLTIEKGPFDQALAFSKLTPDVRAAKKKEYADAGISLIVSAFGETDKPTTSGADPVGTANTFAQFTLDNGLDGIDVDYEDLEAMNKGDGAAEAWVTQFTKTLRQKLPQGQFILTHAPLAPWLSPNQLFAAGAYLTVNKNVGSMIDWYNIQFYNQGDALYTDCEGLLNTSGGTFPGSSVFEIAANGVDLNKLVIGKPAPGDATNGIMDPALLGTCVDQATAKGWKAGVMAFQFPDAGADFITAAKGTSFKGGAAPAPPAGGNNAAAPSAPAPAPAPSAPAPAPAPPAPSPAPPATSPAAPSTGSGKPPGTQFITGPCANDGECASGCCGFKSGLCAGAIIAQERDGGCGFGDPQPNDNAARKLRGQA